MEVNILLFGITRDLVGQQKLTLKIPNASTVADFKKLMQEKYPKLSALNSVAIAVNSAYASDEQSISANDEVALIPPVSGG